MQCACANIFIHPYKNTLLAFYTQHKSYAILYYTMFILSSSTMNCYDVCVRIVCLMPVLCTLFALDSILFTFSVLSLFNTNKRMNKRVSERINERVVATVMIHDGPIQAHRRKFVGWKAAWMTRESKWECEIERENKMGKNQVHHNVVVGTLGCMCNRIFPRVDTAHILKTVSVGYMCTYSVPTR